MTTKRIFIGAYINDYTFKQNYTKLINEFRNISYGKWVEPENMHFTIKFIGDMELKQIEELKMILAGDLAVHSSPVELTGLGVFPNVQNARVLYINMLNSDNEIKRTVQSVENSCYSIGIPKENKAFKPHLTLQRPKDYDINALKQMMEKYKNVNFGSMPNFTVNIIESKLTPHGPIYSVFA